MAKSARAADEVYSIFDELAILKAGAGDRRVLGMHDRVSALHAEVDADRSAIENLRFELPREFGRDNCQRSCSYSPSMSCTSRSDVVSAPAVCLASAQTR